MPSPVKVNGGQVEVLVWVVPGAAHDEIVGLHGGALKVRVRQPPERGRANRAVAELLGARVGAEVELVAGRNTRRKRFRVRAGTVAHVERALGL